MNLIKAQSPAAFAEEYLIVSIWNGTYAPGTILPAERELSDIIGVTRTTLREVLQRLARDGWLTIKHGKPTQVNNFWETSGLSILETLAKLDQGSNSKLIGQILSARTNISAIYIRAAIKNNPEQAVYELNKFKQVPDHAEAYATHDFLLHHALAVASNNAIYVLTLNGLRGLYSKIARFYFTSVEARLLATNFYHELIAYAQESKHDESVMAVRRYGIESGRIWSEIRHGIPEDLVE